METPLRFAKICYFSIWIAKCKAPYILISISIGKCTCSVVIIIFPLTVISITKKMTEKYLGTQSKWYGYLLYIWAKQNLCWHSERVLQW